MRIEDVKKTEKVFLILVVFFFLGFSSISWASDSTFNSPIPEFIIDVGDDVFAQTSDVTIKLEKKIPKPPKEPYSVETAQGIVRSPQDPEDYEELEDPFAGDSEDLPIMKDPLEGYNRWMFGVNESLYDNVLEPVARNYRETVHENLRIGIKNMFSNAMAPVKLISSLIQLDFKKSGQILARTIINTTFGLGGLADVAGEEYGIENVNEDFDQALGYYGIPTGPYIVLPFFGPSTARNIVGRAADGFFSPTFFLAPSPGVSAALTVEENINDVSFIVDDKKQLEESALDEYESVRDFYHQYRHGLLNN